jgi:hypothetical protein
MRATQLLEAIRFSKKDYPSVIADPHLLVGYEIEFIAPVDPSINPNQAQKQIVKQQTPLLLTKIQQDLNIQVKFDVPSKEVVAGRWSLVQDGTIEPNQPEQELGWELISPPLPIAQALSHLQKIFAWMQENRYYTNNTCGFHVNVSYGNRTQSADPLKLILLLGEKYLADLFDRATNEFTSSHIQDMQAKIRKKPQIVLTSDTDVGQLKNQLRKMLSKEKNYTVNLGKQAKKGYLEFRIAGGQGYHQRWQQIENLILRYAFVVKASFDPHSFEREYAEELAQLILQI